MSGLRLGLVGCGRLVERGWLPAVARTAGVRLAAVADPVRSRCERLAPGIPAYESASELIAAGAADAVVLATPASAHLADARLAADAGLAVLVEKPPAAEAAAVADLQPPPWMGFNRRFDTSLRRLRARLPARGRLELVLEQHRPAGAWEAYVVGVAGDDDVPRRRSEDPRVERLRLACAPREVEGQRSRPAGRPLGQPPSLTSTTNSRSGG